MDTHFFRYNQPETLIGKLGRESRADLLEEAAALLGYQRTQEVAEQVTSMLPEAERDEAMARKAHEDAEAALAGAKEALQVAREALDADAQQTQAQWRRTLSNPPAGVELNPDYHPVSRERVSLELREQEAASAVSRAGRKIKFAENQARDALKAVKALRRHADVLGRQERPETPALKTLWEMMK